MRISIRSWLLKLILLLPVGAQVRHPAVPSSVPRVWDDQAIATLEVPLANPVGSPKHISSEFYYRIPVRPIYKTYPVYAPGREPAGYMEWLKQREPEIVWDDAGHKPRLRTQSDWIVAGEAVFDAPIYYTDHRVVSFADVGNPEWYQKTGAPVSKDGTLPYIRYVIRKKDTVDLGNFACGFCHTRVMPDGSVITGGQGNFPFEKSKAWGFRYASETAGRLSAKESALRRLDAGLFAAPWVVPNLAMRTRRGTGYYKVPSIKGAWYRGMFGHNGWCASLEDWFDPNRVRDDYVPTGFNPYGVETFAVKGHDFGLDLSAEDRKALIAFLRTL